MRIQRLCNLWAALLVPVACYGGSEGGGAEGSAGESDPTSGGDADGSSGAAPSSGETDAASGPSGSEGSDTDAGSEGADTDAALDCGDDFLEDPDTLRGQLPTGLGWVGAAISAPVLADATEDAYRSTAAREFNLVTPENALKWGVLEAVRGAPDYAAADEIVDFACENAQAVRGHALIYHDQAPAWLADLQPDALQAAVDEHIDATVGRYQGQVTQWDVVNEAIEDDGTLRSTVFFEQLGAEYIADAFRRARDADPDAALGYNDYSMAGPGPKVDGVFAMVEGLVAAGVPIDYVGFQAHVAAGDVLSGWADEDALRTNIRRFGDLGLDVYITEMDVRVAALGPDKWLAQRESYRRFVNACRAEAACKGVSFWGFTDRHSWVDDFFGPDDPLLFDETYARKEAYEGVLDGFNGAGPDASFGCAISPPGAILCDGAETLATWLPTISGGGDLELSADAQTGAHAVRARVDSSGPDRQALGTRLFEPMNGGTLFMRAYVKIPAATPHNGLTIFGLNESVQPFEGVAFGVSGGAAQLSLTTAGQFPTGGAVAPDTWTCVELEVAVGASGSATLYLDGSPAVSATGTDTLPASGYGSANVGVLWASDDQNGAVMVDEVVVSNTRIGCD